MQLSVGTELVASSGKDLMPIGLMADVPHQAVVGRVVDIMQRHCQLYDTQSRSEMAGINRCLFYDVLPQGIAHCWQLFHFQSPQVFWTVDAFEYILILCFQVMIALLRVGKITK